jgi:hypothetical protein
VEHITGLNARPGYQVHYSAGFDFDERIRAVLPPAARNGVDAGARC